MNSTEIRMPEAESTLSDEALADIFDNANRPQDLAESAMPDIRID